MAKVALRRLTKSYANLEVIHGVDMEVTDPVLYEEYKRLATASIATYGGRYLVRGGATEVLDGDWSPRRLVVVEFESVEKVKSWRNSPEYAEAKKIRDACARPSVPELRCLVV